MMQKLNIRNIRKFGECIARKVSSLNNQDQQQNTIILPPNLSQSKLNVNVQISYIYIFVLGGR